MKFAAFALVAASIWFILPPANVRAATLEQGTGECSITLTGVIAQGDKQQLDGFLAKAPARATLNFCLNSPGGNYTEALAVVETILSSDKIVSTTVPRGAQCYSACALIFLVGHRDEAKEVPDRRLHATAALGFHGPYIKPGNADYDPNLVPRAYRAGVRAIGKLIGLSRGALFPESLLSEGMEKGPEQFLMIDTVEKAGRWDILLIGIKPQRFATRKGVFRACANAMVWKGSIEPYDDTPATPIPFTQGISRIVLKGFGDEAAWNCVADVFDAGQKGHYLNIQWISNDPSTELPPQGPFLKEARQAAAAASPVAPGTPAWFGLSGKTAISSLASAAR